MITPGFFFRVDYEVLIVVLGIVIVINKHVNNSFAHVCDCIRSDGMSARIAAVFAHTDAHRVTVLAVIRQRSDQHFNDLGRL